MFRTVEQYVNKYPLEFENNGYEILRDKRLKEFLCCIDVQNAPDINVESINNKTSQLTVFAFLAFLNKRCFSRSTEKKYIKLLEILCVYMIGEQF